MCVHLPGDFDLQTESVRTNFLSFAVCCRLAVSAVCCSVALNVRGRERSAERAARDTTRERPCVSLEALVCSLGPVWAA